MAKINRKKTIRLFSHSIRFYGSKKINFKTFYLFLGSNGILIVTVDKGNLPDIGCRDLVCELNTNSCGTAYLDSHAIRMIHGRSLSLAGEDSYGWYEVLH